MTINLKKIVVFILVAAIAVTVGLLSGKAIIDGRGGSQQLGSVFTGEELTLPPKGKTAAQFGALQNYLYAKAVMMNAKTVEIHSEGTAEGGALGIKQNQVMRGLRLFDGNNVFIDNSTKNIDGIFAVNVGMQAYYETKADAENVNFRKRDKSDTYGNWSKLALSGAEGTFVNRFGYNPRNFLPFIVNEKTVKSSSQEVENGNYILRFELDVAAAENYKRHVWEMSGSATVPEYTSLSMTVVITKNWVIQSVYTEENYKIKQFGLNATSHAKTTDTYTLNGNVTIPQEYIPA